MGIARALKRAAAADIRVVLVEAGRAPMIELHSHDLVLIGKQDAPGNGEGVSGLTGHGIDQVLAKIEAHLSETTAQAGLITRERHMVAMKTAIAGLQASIDQVISGTFEVELVSEDLRRAVLALDSLIGKVDVEDLLDSIFSSFCIGK
jgi:tRNA modification GTPase